MTDLLQGVMVRLMLVLAPVMCILSGIGVSSTLNTYMKNLDVSRKEKKTSKKAVDHTYPFKNEVGDELMWLNQFWKNSEDSIYLF